MDTDTLARDVMSTTVSTLKADTTLESALKALVNKKVTGMPVVDDDKKMIGMLSEYDILKQIAKQKKMNAEVFQQIVEFAGNVQTIRDDTPLSEIVHLFVNAKFRRLPVVNELNELVGIITRRDLMKVYYYRATLS